MYRSIRVAGFATLLLTVGCSVGPRYRSPQQRISQFHEAPPELTISDSVDPRWWQQLDDPVLDSVIHAFLNRITTSPSALPACKNLGRSSMSANWTDIRWPLSMLRILTRESRCLASATSLRQSTRFVAGFDAVWFHITDAHVRITETVV